MAKKVSAERKAAYQVGLIMTVIGLLLFLSVFVTGAMNFGDFSNFDQNVRSSMFRGIGGMILMIAGSAVRSIGARGIAGSGVVLDPEQARKDLEPFSRQAGGMAKDLLDEAGIDLGRGRAAADDESSRGQVVMLRCTHCRKLNEEDSKFCQECGEPI